MEEILKDQVKLLVDVDVYKDCLMNVQMSASGAHHMLETVKEEVRDLNNLASNLNNQLERVQVEDISVIAVDFSVLFQTFTSPTPHSPFHFPLTNHSRP